MNKLRQNLEKFFQGRYGIDDLGQALFAIYLMTFLLNLISGQRFFYTLSLIIVFIFLYRCLSKNITSRYQENQKYLEKFGKIHRFFRIQKRRWDDRHTHVYRKCPHCGTTIRLPKVKGKHVTNCPKCHKDFDVKV
ncbi:MAG: hypothetical protein ACI4EI_02520 [Muricoprocola sp.]